MSVKCTQGQTDTTSLLFANAPDNW